MSRDATDISRHDAVQTPAGARKVALPAPVAALIPALLWSMPGIAVGRGLATPVAN